MEGWLDDHRGTVLIDGGGHWVHQQMPDEVNDALLWFLSDVTPAGLGPVTDDAPQASDTETVTPA
jgi:hypothetical protein